MSLVEHAKRELKLAGLFSKESNYEGLLGDATLRLIETFAKEGHSGFSASCARDLFNKLSNYENLTPITNDKEDWVNVSEMATEKVLYQCKRNPSLFSIDLITYYHVDKPKEILEFEKIKEYRNERK